MRQFNFTSGKVPFSGTPIMPKMGKHVKRIVIGAAAAVVIVVLCQRCNVSDPGAGTGGADNFQAYRKRFQRRGFILKFRSSSRYRK